MGPLPYPWLVKFKRRPRDAAAGGIPLTQNDQIMLFSRNRTTQSTNIRVWARVYDPDTDTAATVPVVGPFSTSGTTFTGETAQRSTAGTFSDGQILCGVSITADSITNPVQLWVAALLTPGAANQGAALLCQGYLHGSNVVSWTAGSQPTASQFALADAGEQGALYTFQGTVANGAGGAGDQSLTITLAAGSRVRLMTVRITNNDSSARATQILIDDGTNTLVSALSGSLAVGGSFQFPWLGGIPAAAGNNMDLKVFELAGGNRLVGTVAAVSASEDTAWAVTLWVWGAAPTFTLAGASTPTLTTNTSRFETG